MVQIILSGIAMGCIYALISLGFVMIYNAVGVVNFAQGDLVVLGTFMAFATLVQMKLPYLPASILAMVMMGLLGYVFQLAAYQPLRDKPILTVIISTIALGIVLRNAILFIWGATPLTVPAAVSSEPIRVMGAAILPQNLFIIAITVVALAAQYMVMTRTRLGRQMRATAQDQTTARLMGISAGRIIAITFFYATSLAGLAGLLVGPVFYATTDYGGMLALKAFTATVIGGFGHELGAVVGGLIVGLLEVVLGIYISSRYKEALLFVIMILFLLVRPRGLFGEPIGEKV